MANTRGDRLGTSAEHGSYDNDREPHGAAHGNLLGRAEHAVRDYFRGDTSDDRSSGRTGEQAADDWNRRFGREGYQGSYGVDPSYRDYRERHLAELDRDYDEWCRDREHQFHRDFGDWRSQRRHVTNQPGDQSTVGGDRAVDSLVADESSGGKPSRRTRR